MSVNSYLMSLANHAIVRDKEREKIRRSIATLEARLKNHFNLGLTSTVRIDKQLIFGSYTRGTNLPRDMDAQSDVDYMIVFNDGSARPQTYIDRLKRFAQSNYSSSEIRQSSPTVVLSLNHISFDLVPAIDTFLFGLQIPAKASSYEDWVSTNPDDINARMSEKNKENSNLIKPLARLAKYWNSKAGYPFESFELEKRILDHGFWSFSSFLGNPQTLWTLFYDFMSNLDVDLFAPQWKTDRIERLKSLLRKIRDSLDSEFYIQAESYAERLLPPLS